MTSSQVARRRGVAVLVLLVLAGVATITFWPDRLASPFGSPEQTTAAPNGTERVRYEMPPNYLAWVPGGFDDPRVDAKVDDLPAIGDTVVVAGDTLWLRKTADADGQVVDQPPSPYAFPIDAFAVDPGGYAPFVGSSVRAKIVDALRSGKAVLGQHSARLRKLGPGGRLTFRTGSVVVGAVVPDAAVGWAEVLVNDAVGRRLGIAHDRYLLAHASRDLSRPAWKRLMLRFVGEDPVRVDVPGGTRYVRVASGVNPPIVVKEVFGEFAATPNPDDPAYLTIDPAWVDRNIVTTDVPLLGTVTCHKRLIPMVRGALQEVFDAGLASEIKVYSGCWAARTVARGPTAPPSTHAYGAAIDINAPQSPYGAPPNMNAEVVAIFERWGFNWGGDFLIPDGHHFEFWRIPEGLPSS